MKATDPADTHTPDAIRKRLSQRGGAGYIGDFILGGIDGCVTTFAIVTASVGAGLDTVVIVVLGFANLLADGFSMAASNFQSARSQELLIRLARRDELNQIREHPEGEREEIKQIYAAKGFTGQLLDDVVQHVTSDPDLWVETMLTEELGLPIEPPHPVKAALVTYLAFLLIGGLPLIPFIVPGLNSDMRFTLSIIAAGLSFFSVGWGKGWVFKDRKLLAGLETLATGILAAGIAYGVAVIIRHLVQQAGYAV
ncbi:MAG: VIT1/CCC1 family predicted Fe2+/Mn2+ transporter [Kiritimatiellia bacterium]